MNIISYYTTSLNHIHMKFSCQILWGDSYNETAGIHTDSLSSYDTHKTSQYIRGGCIISTQMFRFSR
jgi:hypothetical protein